MQHKRVIYLRSLGAWKRSQRWDTKAVSNLGNKAGSVYLAFTWQANIVHRISNWLFETSYFFNYSSELEELSSSSFIFSISPSDLRGKAFLSLQHNTACSKAAPELANQP